MPESMKRILQSRFAVSLILLIVIYLVGVVTVLLGYADDLMLLTPYNLIFASALILVNSAGINTRYLIWFLVIASAGYFIEVLGVKTGFIFGEYSYGAGLGIKFLDVPLILGLNWAILVFAIASVTQQLNLHIAAKSAIAAALMVAYDVLLEPVAIRFDFWSWAGGHVPLQNYIAWWVIAFFMLIGTHKLVKNLENRLAIYVIGIQTIFFLVLILKERLAIF